MHFVVLTQYFEPEVGASQVRLGAIARELQCAGHSVEVVTAMPNYPTGVIFPAYRGRLSVDEDWGGVSIHRVWVYASTGAGVKRLLNYFSFTLTSLFGLSKCRRPDILFCESPPPLTSIPARIACAFWRRPFLFNVADMWPDVAVELGLMREGALVRLARKLEAWSYRKAALVNAVTEGIRETLITKKGVPEDKITFLPNGVDTTLFRPSPPDVELRRELGLEGKTLLVYPGTLGYVHGLEFTLDVMDCLQHELPDVMLVFIGSGSEREKLQSAARSRSLPNVRFLDPRPPEYIARLLTLAYAGFASQRNIPLMEGARSSKIFPIMAAGKPLIYCASGEGARLIQAANSGIVVPPESPKALIAAIRELIAEPRTAAELGANGRAYVEAHHSWSALVRNWLLDLDKRRFGT